MLKRIDADGGAPAGDADPVAAESNREVLSKKVLVAEDNVVSQQVARHYLQAMGCNVVVVEDGRAAVAACARQEFGLVLMDLQMPHMDGLQATQEIRKQERPGHHVPILALTAKSAANELARCTAAGMNGLLTNRWIFRDCGRSSTASAWRAARSNPSPGPAHNSTTLLT